MMEIPDKLAWQGQSKHHRAYLSVLEILKCCVVTIQELIQVCALSERVHGGYRDGCWELEFWVCLRDPETLLGVLLIAMPTLGSCVQCCPAITLVRNEGS